MHVGAVPPEARRGHWIPGVKVIVSHLKWVLRTELRSPARADAHSYPLKYFFHLRVHCLFVCLFFNTLVGVLRPM